MRKSIKILTSSNEGLANPDIKHFDWLIKPETCDFIGNAITEFYYGMKGKLLIFNGGEILKNGKKIDKSI